MIRWAIVVELLGRTVGNSWRVEGFVREIAVLRQIVGTLVGAVGAVGAVGGYGGRVFGMLGRVK
ncbi:hypothetical protein [Kribbella hippodromi]|uniref:hypothetical protein n=1 Tax=Kribbella hippodromi TaxID=434347 RepID=UPI0031DE2513